MLLGFKGEVGSEEYYQSTITSFNSEIHKIFMENEQLEEKKKELLEQIRLIDREINHNNDLIDFNRYVRECVLNSREKE